MRLLIALVLFLWWLSLNAKEADFISDLEYGLALYKTLGVLRARNAMALKANNKKSPFIMKKAKKNPLRP